MTERPKTGVPGPSRSARQFGYYYEWISAILECWQCGWKGTFKEGTVGMFEQLMDSRCPKCKGWSPPMLAIVNYPTTEESKQNWTKLSDSEKASITAREAFLKRFQDASLKSPDQLPDLEGSSLILVWDYVSTGKGAEMNVLRHGGTEVWREPALWEGYGRFEEIVSILRAKYGERLADLEPTNASCTYLYGDSFSAIARIDKLRASLPAAALKPAAPAQSDRKRKQV